MTAPHEHADLCATLRDLHEQQFVVGDALSDAADAIDDLHARLAAMEAERDVYRGSCDVLRDAALTYLRALQCDRRSIGRLLVRVISQPPATPATTPEAPDADR